MPDNLESILRRIEKLLAIAGDHRGDPNEAAAAAHQAERMMRKFQIDHADVVESQLAKKGESFASLDVAPSLDLTSSSSGRKAAWAGLLGVAIAKLNDCQCRYVRALNGEKSLRFSGYAPDAQICRYTWMMVVNSLIAATPKGIGADGANAFRQGYIASVCASLKAALREKKKTIPSDGQSLLVIKSAAVAGYFGSVRYVRSNQRETSNLSAFVAGQKAGAQLDIGRKGVEGSPAIQGNRSGCVTDCNIG